MSLKEYPLVLLICSLLLANQSLAAETGNESSANVSSDSESERKESEKKDSSKQLPEADVGAAFFGSNAGVTQSQTAASPSYQVTGSGVAAGRAPGGLMTPRARGHGTAVAEGVYVYPAIQFGLGYNDNVASSNVNQIGSMVQFYRPDIVGEVKSGSDRYTLSYHGNYGRYTNSSADNYDNHEVWLAGDNYFSSRTRIGWGVGYMQSTDARGSTDVEVTSEPNRWHAPVVRAFGAYGAKDAIGRIELEASMTQKRYENNLAQTQVNDADLGMVSSRFFYRIMPKTSLVFELRNSTSNYTLATSSHDSTDTRAYFGATWDITNKTSGTVKVGPASKKFTSNLYSDSTSTSWEVAVRWKPLTYSSLDLMTMRAPSDSTGLGDYLQNTSTTLTWNHRWSEVISTRVSMGSFKTDYVNNPRSDRISNYSLGGYYDFGNNLRFSVDYSFSERTSNQPNNGYRRNVLMFGVEAFL